MDLSLVGWKEGLIKALKVALWVAVSGAISALIEALKSGTFSLDPYTMGLVNIVLAGLLKWVSTKK